MVQIYKIYFQLYYIIFTRLNFSIVILKVVTLNKYFSFFIYIK